MDIQELRRKIKLLNENRQILLSSDKDLDVTILSPLRFEKAIALYESTTDTGLKERLVYSLGKYVCYNYYQRLHVQKDSLDDLENERIYQHLKQSNIELYILIEKHIDWELEKTKLESKFLK